MDNYLYSLLQLLRGLQELTIGISILFQQWAQAADGIPKLFLASSTQKHQTTLVFSLSK